MERDKLLEYNRYNLSSAQRLQQLEGDLSKSGSHAFPQYLRTPYIYYENLTKENIKQNQTVLDLCCGDGIHSVTLAKYGAEIIATDIAENSIELAKIRAEKEGCSNINFQVADAENLNFPESSFDVVTCVGSLSYVDLEVFIEEVKKVLKTQGKLIILDSFNHNPIYRLNRFIHYLRGKRSWSTLKRMPTDKTVAYIKSQFSDFNIEYFGVFSFLAPVIGKFYSSEKTKKIIDSLDCRFRILKKFCFKIVIIVTK